MKHSEIFEKLVAVSQTRPLNAEELQLINSHPQGLAGLIGLRFTRISADEIRSEVDVVPDHHQPWGVANGGLFCTITESTASVGSLILAGKPVVLPRCAPWWCNNPYNQLLRRNHHHIPATTKIMRPIAP